MRRKREALTDLSRPERELTAAEAEGVRGGVEDPNLFQVEDPNQRRVAGLLPAVQTQLLPGR